METNFTSNPRTDLKIKERFCPSCRKEVKRFALTSLHSPVEQWRMPYFDKIAKNNAFAGITFGQMSLEEFFILCFRSVCNQCGHISMWQITPEEIDLIIASGSDGYAVAWMYAYDDLRGIYDRMREDSDIPPAYTDRLVEIINLLYPDKAIENAKQ